MSFELANKYAEFQIPKETKDIIVKRGLSLSAAKIAIFADTEKITNQDIDYYMSLKPARMEDESYEDYRNRRKFQKVLVKRRTLLYDYSVYETN